MPSQKNKDIVADLSDKLKEAKAALLFDYRGLNAAKTEDLRLKAREAGVELRVRKNRLLKLAIKNAGCEPLDDALVGPTAVAFGIEDPVAPAKLLSDLLKDNKNVVLKGGLLEGKAISAAEIETLSKLPSKEELLSQLAGDLLQPVAKLASALEESRAKIARVLDALREKREEESGGGSAAA